MILVDIYIPALDTIYDFRVREDIPISQLKAEIVEMLCKKEKAQESLKSDDFLLCSKDNGKILAPEATLESCGIQNGSRLILV